ncbi:MAG: hypothetical protein WCR55_06200 [Lentisphaerota bacterium]
MKQLHVKAASIFLMLMMFVSIAFASEVKYMAIVDAGSSGSRLYLYKMSLENGVPRAQEIKLEGNIVEPGLYTYAKKPEKVSDYFKGLLESLKSGSAKVGVKPGEVFVYVLSTAGMRIAAPCEREKLYSTLVKYLNENGYDKVYAGMITGHAEGLFDWVAVNYLLKTFSDNAKSVGVLDLGGGSSQIAFETQEQNIFVSQLKIGNKIYTVYSRSYLGLGLDYARYQFSNVPECWPKGYPMPASHIKADPDFTKGVKEFSMLINFIHNLNSYKGAEIPEDMNFIGISGFYYLTSAKAVNMSTTFSLADMQKAGNNFSKRTWEELEKDYPDDPYLFSYLLNLELTTALLKYGYDFHPDRKIQAYNKIDGISVNWTLGAAICLFEGNPIK